MQLFEKDNFNGLWGNTTQHCMRNQDYYKTHLCGPKGVEQLSFARWKALGYDAYKDANHELLQSYAGELESRVKELGGASSGDGEYASMAAQAWFERDQRLSDEEQGARFTYLMWAPPCTPYPPTLRNALTIGLLCVSGVASGATRKPVCWTTKPPRDTRSLPRGALQELQASGPSTCVVRERHRLWTCAPPPRPSSDFMCVLAVEEKFEVWGEFSRSVHRLALEAAMCKFLCAIVCTWQCI